MFKNHFKTVMLLGLLTALLLWIGSFWGRSGLIIGAVFAVAINFASYFWSDKLVLRMYNAKEVRKSSEPRLYDLVEEVASEAGLPMPKVFIIQSPNPNAFATGRNPKHAAVACTSEILNLLSRDELKGVIAHEMAHVKNRDILIATIAATIAGVISYMASMAQWAAIFGGFGGKDNDRGGNVIGLLALAIVTPIVATIIQLAISRSREYIADESGAKMIGDSKSLASALEKLEAGARYAPMRGGNTATASLFIVNPFRGSALLNLFSTHPPIAERIKRLRAMRL